MEYILKNLCILLLPHLTKLTIHTAFTFSLLASLTLRIKSRLPLPVFTFSLYYQTYPYEIHNYDYSIRVLTLMVLKKHATFQLITSVKIGARDCLQSCN